MENIPIDAIITLLTVLVTVGLGELSKKFKWVEKKQIPLQNIFVGLVVCAVQYIVTKDFNAAVALSGLMSGGAYDACKSFALLFSKDGEE